MGHLTLMRRPVVAVTWFAAAIVLPAVVLPIVLVGTFGPGGPGLPSGRDLLWATVDLVGIVLGEVAVIAGLVNYLSTEICADGLRQRRCFRPRFLPWNEISRARLWRNSRLELSSGAVTVDVPLLSYRDPYEVFHFIDDQLEASGGLRAVWQDPPKWARQAEARFATATDPTEGPQGDPAP